MGDWYIWGPILYSIYVLFRVLQMFTICFCKRMYKTQKFYKTKCQFNCQKQYFSDYLHLYIFGLSGVVSSNNALTRVFRLPGYGDKGGGRGWQWKWKKGSTYKSDDTLSLERGRVEKQNISRDILVLSGRKRIMVVKLIYYPFLPVNK